MLAGLRDAEGHPIELAMTSNGTLLAKKARDLKNAGLTRLNVSLDALDDAVFQRMNGVGTPVADVLDGIAAAQAAGLTPLKVNAVVKRGVNESEILPLVRHFRHTSVILRFIEFMDVGATNGWRLDDVVTASETLARIDEAYPLRPIDPNYRGETAERWEFLDGGGEIGVIASVTQAFCHDCGRLRLTTDGKLYTCLFASEGTDLRGLLRASTDAGDGELRQRIAALWRRRADHYSRIRLALATPPREKVEMSFIGG
jgi:cyclic pyranopterin phosphate synthase